MKKHFIGATYELTQENFQHIIQQLDNANEALDLAIHILENIDETNCFSLPEEALSTIRELRGKK